MLRLLAAAAVPVIDGALELDAIAGGRRRHREHAETLPSFEDGGPESLRWVVCGAMTSGGLLAAVPESAAGSMPGTVVGRLVAGEPGSITVS